jgi:hypothetical protein
MPVREREAGRREITGTKMPVKNGWDMDLLPVQ